MSIPQLPLALRHSPDQRLETYVNAPDGAIAQLRSLASSDEETAGYRDPSGADWVYLAGPAGVGKTHLLLAACAQADIAGRRAAYVPLSAAVGRLREALQSLDTNNDLLALDGIEAIAGRREDEIALFDTHNRARQAGIAVIYASRENPDELKLTLPDLRSRLSQCTRIVLTPLDDDGRAQVLRQRAQRRGLALEEAALEWMLKRMDRDLGGLTQLLDKLDRASLAAQRRITVPFLKRTIDDET
ncbi:DnaA regulatory inactivator Hda [Lysobacter enzymogenes]|uniref:DnaA regulatory inactivator Hda n=1 Tax=Lysobacter enzymogenes TaxID=69 RepID=A0A0S2DDJ7_LYSEN|nr:DnaA regulatory inactivator Hda [Lysobacter enzymogenes]ALN56580.1 DnaA regulatory inactivator Hda [Lysobacter enzymogenes]QCW25386.1 DnaA regulatory inactivator Hda [Lysobacter enzymogenes]ROU04988.1 DnaA regulatory inactivator Hda [Lysobacter enzymogenes]